MSVLKLIIPDDMDVPEAVGTTIALQMVAERLGHQLIITEGD